MTRRGPLSALYGQGYFNATKLSASQVADLFVPADQFEQLARVDNAVLTGARGSGKTTMMKMLTREALANWDDPVGRELLERDTLPIYFGSDVVLRSQLLDESELPKDVSASVAANVKSLQRAKSTLHFLQSTLTAVKYEVKSRNATPSRDADEEIATIAGLWQLELPYRSWDSLVASASRRITDISRALSRIADGASAGAGLAEKSAPPGLADLFVVFRDTLTSAFAGLPSRWVLLFDELEFFPQNVRSDLIHLIRALGPEFGLKLAFTPVSTTGSYLREVSGAFASSGHDYLHVQLGATDGNKEDALAFATDLVSKVFAFLGVDGSIESVFGVSMFAAEASSLRTEGWPVVSRPSEAALIEELAETHPRFRKYAVDKEILTEDDRKKLGESARASRIRKGLPVMLLWKHRLSSAPIARQERRSRKTSIIFTGFPTFLEMGDGNPRTTLRLVDRALAASDARRGEHGLGPLRVRPETQAAVIDVEREIQLSLAEVYLARHGAVRGQHGGMQLLDDLGQIFERNVYMSRQFDPDPVTTFVLDEGVPLSMVNAIADAIYTGVLVDAGPATSTGEGDRRPASPSMHHLYGRRYRLSYLLGTTYWLPVRKGQTKALSTVLRRTTIDRPGFSQPEMFTSTEGEP